MAWLTVQLRSFSTDTLQSVFILQDLKLLWTLMQNNKDAQSRLIFLIDTELAQPASGSQNRDRKKKIFSLRLFSSCSSKLFSHLTC